MPSSLDVHQEETTILLDTQNQDNTSSKKQRGCCSWKGEASFDWLFFRRLWKLLCILRAYPALILPLLSILDAHVVSRVGKLTGKFYSVFLDGDRHGFYKLVYHSSGLFLAAAGLYALLSFLGEYFAFAWRRRLTQYILQFYSTNKHFYWLENIDNPDQRIAQDLSQLCTTFAKLLTDLAAVPYNLVYYTLHVHQQLQSTKVLLAAYAWFIGGSLVLKLMIRPSANLLFTQEAREGDFRKGLLRFVQYKVEIAASNGVVNEESSLLKKLRLVLWYQVRVVFWDFLLTFLTRGYGYFGTLVNFLCIGYVVFSGGFPSGTSASLAEQISNTSFYLLMLVYSFGKVPESAKSFATLIGLTPRVSQLIERLQQVEEETNQRMHRCFDSSDCLFHRLDMDSTVSLRVWHLSCWTLGDRLIVKNLELFLRKGESLLITGASGVGKSTLLLTLLDLHDKYKGSIEILPETSTMILTQQSIVAPGSTLSSQLTYPLDEDLSPNQMLVLLEEVGLADVWKSWCDSDLFKEQEWSRVFSAGELQRIALARVFYHRPLLLFLDESTSALPGYMQKEIYLKIKDLGISIISVGQRKSLNKLHDWHLHLHGSHQDGQWTLTSSLSSTPTLTAVGLEG